MKAVIFLLTLLFTLKPLASESVFKIKYGVSFEPTTDKVLNDTYRAIDLGYYSDLSNALSFAISGGWYGNKETDFNSGYACAQFGTTITPFEWLYIDQYFGPCYFSHVSEDPNRLLSGHWQGKTNTGIGWRDPETKSNIGINIMHFSNGGIARPNTGVNLLMLNMSFGL